MIELRHLQYVIAVAESGSFRRAADKIGIKVSTISRRIRDLEEGIGAALFIRHRSGVHLTRTGEHFLRRARQAMNLIQSAERDVGAIGRGEHGIVRIGISTPLAPGFMGQLIKTYTACHPDVRLDFVEAGPPTHIQAIRNHELDVAFLTGLSDVEDCETANLWTERIYVVMPHDDHLAAREQVSWEDLRERHFVVGEEWPGPGIHDYLMKHLAELGYRPSIELQAVYRDTTLMQIVAVGRGLTLASEARVTAQFPGVVYRQLGEEAIQYWAIWSPSNDNPAFRGLLTLARTFAAKSSADKASLARSPSLDPTPPLAATSQRRSRRL